MATVLVEIEEKLRALSQRDKAALIRVLIGELDGSSESDAENAWIAEAKRRHQELIDGRVRGIPGDRVFAIARALLER